MSFALAPLGILLGLAGIAGALYLLQRLRVRHREVPVVTTLFWKQAVEETRARVFVRRFRHWPAYVLFCAIGALLWLGFAQPRAGGGGEGRTVVLLDGSAGMAWQSRFKEARQALLDDSSSFDPDRTHVLFCGGTVRTLLAPGENPLLLAKRLEGLAPEAAPASVERVVRAMLDEVAGETTFVVYGDAPLELHALDLQRTPNDDELPGPPAVERRSFAPARAGNRGIAALGIAEAASGRWDRVDVYVEVRGGEGPVPRMTVDGLDLPEPAEGEGTRLVWTDIAAAGGLLQARLPEDGLALDDAAAVRLPNRTPIRVAVSPTFAPFERVQEILRLDPGIEVVEGGPDLAYDVELNMADAAPRSGDRPMLSFPSRGTREHTIEVVEPTEDARATLGKLQATLALAEIDGAALAEMLGRPVSVGVQDGPARAIRAAPELLGPDRTFVESRAFPLFLAGAIRHLAGRETFRRFAAAGEPVADADAAYRHADTTLDAVGTDFVPPVAGDYVADGDMFTASLLTGALTASAGATGAAESEAGGAFDVALLVMLLAFALLLVEWTLFRAGRVP